MPPRVTLCDEIGEGTRGDVVAMPPWQGQRTWGTARRQLR